MSEEPVLELKGVHAAYGRIDVLFGVDLVVLPAVRSGRLKGAFTSRGST